MTAEELKARTKKFAIRVIRLYRALPKNGVSEVLGKQLLRSGTSVAANYRAALRARSRTEFIAKLGIVVDEADETAFWLELIRESDLVSPSKLVSLEQESHELLAIMASARNTTKSRS